MNVRFDDEGIATHHRDGLGLQGMPRLDNQSADLLQGLGPQLEHARRLTMTSFVLNRRNRFQLQRQLKHSQDAALYRRTLAILEIDQGKPVGAVAEALGVTRQAVYNWIEAYAEAYDPLSLVDAARSGRPSSWTPDLQRWLRKLLKESPSQWGLHGVNWTVP